MEQFFYNIRFDIKTGWSDMTYKLHIENFVIAEDDGTIRPEVLKNYLMSKKNTFWLYKIFIF